MIGIFVLLMAPMGLLVANTALSTTTDNTTKPHGQFLIKALGLTADQTTQFERMFQQHVAAMKAEKERFETQVNGILTPDQQGKFKNLMQKRAGWMKKGCCDANRECGRPGDVHQRGGRFEGDLKQLNLSADQQAQIKTIKQDMRTKLAAVAPGDNVTRQQIHQDMQTQIAKVLTPDQLTQWNHLKQTKQMHRGGKGYPSQSR